MTNKELLNRTTDFFDKTLQKVLNSISTNDDTKEDKDYIDKLLQKIHDERLQREKEGQEILDKLSSGELIIK